jgi:hypothetical protein
MKKNKMFLPAHSEMQGYNKPSAILLKGWPGIG